MSGGRRSRARVRGRGGGHADQPFHAECTHVAPVLLYHALRFDAADADHRPSSYVVGEAEAEEFAYLLARYFEGVHPVFAEGEGGERRPVLHD